MSNVELGGVNGVKRGKSHHNLTAAQAAMQIDIIGILSVEGFTGVAGGPLFLAFYIMFSDFLVNISAKSKISKKNRKIRKISLNES